MTTTAPELVPIEDLAEILNTSILRIRHWLAKGDLGEILNVDGKRYVLRSNIEDFLLRRERGRREIKAIFAREAESERELLDHASPLSKSRIEELGL